MSTTITRLERPDVPLPDDELARLYAAPAVPWLRANFVTSLDGAVEVRGRSAGLSSPADQRLMQVLRSQSDAVLLGAGTFRIERYGESLLTQQRRARRRERGQPEQPRLVIVSRSLRLDPASPAFGPAGPRPIVLTCATAPADRRAALRKVCEVLDAGERGVELTTGLSLLHERGLLQVLTEGGPHLLGELTAADLVDDLCLTLSPLLAGPGAGRITAGPTSEPRRLPLRQILTDGEALLLRFTRDW